MGGFWLRHRASCFKSAADFLQSRRAYQCAAAGLVWRLVHAGNWDILQACIPSHTAVHVRRRRFWTKRFPNIRQDTCRARCCEEAACDCLLWPCNCTSNSQDIRFPPIWSHQELCISSRVVCRADSSGAARSSLVVALPGCCEMMSRTCRCNCRRCSTGGVFAPVCAAACGI